MYRHTFTGIRVLVLCQRQEDEGEDTSDKTVNTAHLMLALLRAAHSLGSGRSLHRLLQLPTWWRVMYITPRYSHL